MPQMMNLMWLPLMIYFSMAMMIIIIVFNMKTPLIKNENNEMKKIFNLIMMTNLFSSFDPSTSVFIN